MAVLCEGYSVIVRTATVAAKYPGGLENLSFEEFQKNRRETWGDSTEQEL